MLMSPIFRLIVYEQASLETPQSTVKPQSCTLMDAPRSSMTSLCLKGMSSQGTSKQPTFIFTNRQQLIHADVLRGNYTLLAQPEGPGPLDLVNNDQHFELPVQPRSSRPRLCVQTGLPVQFQERPVKLSNSSEIIDLYNIIYDIQTCTYILRQTYPARRTMFKYLVKSL